VSLLLVLPCLARFAAAEPEVCQPVQEPASKRLDHGVDPKALDRELYATLDAARLSTTEMPLAAVAVVRVERARAMLSERAPDAAVVRGRVHFARTLARWAIARRSGKSEGDPEPETLEFEAATLWSQAGAEAATLGLHRSRSFAFGYRAELYAQATRFEDALELNDTALASAAAVQDPDILARWNAQRGSLLRQLDRNPEAISAYRSARESLVRLRGSETPARFLESATPVHNALADLLLQASRVEGADEQALLREVQDVLEGLKTAELRDYFGDPCLAEQPRALSHTLPGAIVLYPVVLADRVELLIGAGGRLHRRPSDVGPGDLIEEARLFQLRLRDRTTQRHRASAEKLYDWLVRPIEDFLQGEVDALVFVPSGALMEVPIAALWNAQSKKYLIEEIAVAVTPSLQLTDPRPLDRRHAKSLVAGLTTTVDGFDALPSVATEMDAVEASFPGVRIEGEAFSLLNFLEVFASQPFGIVHIASHGVFEGDSSKSYLLTHAGRISLDRLAEIVGSTRFRTERPLELLTLSACDTAAGDERAVLGLAGIAVQSGARSALATLWRVNDEATSRVIAAFYRELARPGVSRAAALQRAQRELLESKVFRHPSFWAPFLMINNWL
jgi:CHAT domain-containing protein